MSRRNKKGIGKAGYLTYWQFGLDLFASNLKWQTQDKQERKKETEEKRNKEMHDADDNHVPGTSAIQHAED